jgi:erythrocyte band 7 integral membrane protein
MSSQDDIIPLTNKAYSQTTSVPSTSQQSSAVKQKKGEFATSGVQPSFALELDISTIEHVKYIHIEVI